MRHAVKWVTVGVSGFALGFIIAWGLTALLPPAEPGYPFAAIAASFVVNLICLAFALGRLPIQENQSVRLPHLRGCGEALLFVAGAHVGLWVAPGHEESVRVFAVLALLCWAQCLGMFAGHALLCALLRGSRSRAPRMLCALGLVLVTTALFWSREPIQMMSKFGGKLAEYSPMAADGVMKFSPPAAVAATWYLESDAARGKSGRASRRFDLVHGPLTYAVWIGSYQAVAVPDILPAGLGGDFYSRTAFSPGVVLLILIWALPIVVVGDLVWIKKLSHLPHVDEPHAAA